MTAVIYSREQALPVEDYIDVVGNSTLGPTRPLADRDRVAAMIAAADLVVTARIDGRCIGIARCLSDFAWVAYCGDLAVHNDFQGRGIGKNLLQKVRDELGHDCGVALISMPESTGFYDHVGPSIDLHPIGDAYWMKRRRDI